jgi:hypothetical protein
MSIDYADIYADLYTRAATDPDGTTLRALLGGATSVFPAEKLGQVAGVVFPWLVWRAGAVANTSGEMRDIQASWWAYVAPNIGDKRLHEIASALEALYGSSAALAFSDGRLSVTFIGQPRHDESLKARGLEVRIGFRRL